MIRRRGKLLRGSTLSAALHIVNDENASGHSRSSRVAHAHRTVLDGAKMQPWRGTFPLAVLDSVRSEPLREGAAGRRQQAEEELMAQARIAAILGLLTWAGTAAAASIHVAAMMARPRMHI